MKRLKTLMLVMLCAFVPLFFSACSGVNASVTFDKSEIALAPGDNTNILDIATFKNISASAVSFVSSNENVFTVSDNKTIMAKAVGQANLYARSGETTLGVLIVKVRGKLMTPEGLKFDDTSNRIVWEKVYAEDSEGQFVSSSYKIVMSFNGTEKEETIYQNYYSISNEGEYTFKVQALGGGRFEDSNFTEEFSFTYGRLEVATGLSFDKETLTLSWNRVPDAVYYRLKINGVMSAPVTEPRTIITLPGAGNFNVSVVAYSEDGAGKYPSESEAVLIRKLLVPEVRIEDGHLTFNTAEIVKFEITYGELSFVTSENTSTLEGVPPGIHDIKVKAVGGEYDIDSEYSETVTVTKLPKASLEFVRTEGKEVVLKLLPESAESLTYIVTYGTKTKTIERVTAITEFRISLTEIGENLIYVESKGTGEKINGDKSEAIKIINLETPDGVKHQVVDGKSIITINKVDLATSYGFVVNGTEKVLTKTAEDETTITYDIGNTMDLIVDGKISVQIAPQTNEYFVSLPYNKEITVLGTPLNITKTETGFAFTAVPNAVLYIYKVFRADGNYAITDSNPLTAGSTDKLFVDMDLSYGYYVVRVYSVGDEDNYLSSIDFAELKYFIDEQLKAPVVEFAFDSVANKYRLAFSMEDDRSTGYHIYVDGTKLNEEGRKGAYYYFGNIFNDVKTYEISVVAVGVDSTILKPSEQVVLLVTKVASPQDPVISDDEKVNFTLPLNADRINAFVNGQTYTELPVDISNIGSDFEFQIKYVAKESVKNHYYIDSDVKIFNFSRQKTPTGLNFESDTIFFSSTEDYNAFEISLIVATLNQESKAKVIGKVSGSNVNEITLLKSQTGASYNYTFSINSLIEKAIKDTAFKDAFDNRISLKLSLKAIKVENEEYISLNSFNATTTTGQTSLDIVKLESPKVDFNKENMLLSWNAVSEGATYYIYINNTLKYTTDLLSQQISISDLTMGENSEVTVKASHTSFMMSENSNKIILKYLAPINEVIVKTDGTISYNLVSVDEIEKIEISYLTSIIDNQKNTSFDLVDGVTEYGIKLIGKSAEEDLNGNKIFFIDSQKQSYIIQSMVSNPITPTQANIVNGKLQWTEVNVSGWNANNAAALYYTVSAKAGETVAMQKTNIKTNSIDLAQFEQLQSGSYNFMVTAEVNNYVLKAGETGYRASSFIFDTPLVIDKLASATELKVECIVAALDNKIEANINAAMELSFKGNYKTGTKFEIYLNDTLLEEVELTISNGVYKYSNASLLSWAQAGNFRVGVKVKEAYSISSDISNLNIKRMPKVQDVTLSADGDVKITTVEAASFGYIIGVTQAGIAKYIETSTNVFNIFTLEGISKTAGDLKIEVIAKGGLNTLASAAEFSLNTKILSIPVIEQSREGLSITSSNPDDGEVIYVLSFSNGESFESNGNFAFPDAWDGGELSVTVYAKKENSITSEQATKLITIDRLDTISNLVLTRDSLDPEIMKGSFSLATGASEYILKIIKDNVEIEKQTISTTEFNFSILNIPSAGDYTLQIIASAADKLNSHPASYALTKLDNHVTGIGVSANGQLIFEAEGTKFLACVNDIKYLTSSKTMDIEAAPSGIVNIKIKKLGNFDSSGVSQFDKIILDGDYVEQSLMKLSKLEFLINSEGYITFDFPTIDGVFSFRAEYLGVEKEFDAKMLDEISSITYGFKMVDFASLFNLSGEVTLSIRAYSNNYLRSDPSEITFTVDDAFTIELRRGNNFAEDYLLFNPSKAYSRFSVALSNGTEEFFLYESEAVSGFWVEGSNGFKTFSGTRYENAGAVTYTNTPIFGMNIANFLGNRTGNLTIKILGLTENSSSIYSNLISLTRLEPITKVNIYNGEVAWEGIVPTADGYYVYLTNILTNVSFFKYVKGNNITDFAVSDEIVSNSGEYTVGVKAVSETEGTVASQMVTLVNDSGVDKTIFKLAAPNLLSTNDTTGGYDSTGTLVWKSEELEALMDVSNINNLMIELIKNKTYKSPFTYNLSNFVNQKVTLRFENEFKSYFMTMYAYELVKLSPAQKTALSQLINLIHELGTSADVEQALEAIRTALSVSEYGFSNNRILFDDRGKEIPAGTYTLSIMQNGYSALGWLNSAYSAGKRVYVGIAPKLQAEKIGEDYFLSFNPIDVSDGTNMVMANEYFLRLDSENYFAIRYDESLKDGIRSGWTAISNAQNAAEFDLTVQNGRVYINLSKNVGSSVIRQTYDHTAIYARGNGFSINGKSTEIRLQLLQTPNVQVLQGVLTWETQNVDTKIVYTPEGKSLEETIISATGQHSWEMNELSAGLYTQMSFQAKGSIGTYSVKVDSPVIELGQIYKLEKPTVGTELGRFKITDNNIISGEEVPKTYKVFRVLDGDNKFGFYKSNDGLITYYEPGEDGNDMLAKGFNFQAGGSDDIYFDPDNPDNNTFNIAYINSNETVTQAYMMWTKETFTQTYGVDLEGRLTWKPVTLENLPVYYKVNVVEIMEQVDGNQQVFDEIYYTSHNYYDFKEVSAFGKFKVTVQPFIAYIDEDNLSTVSDVDGNMIKSSNVQLNGSYLLLGEKFSSENIVKYSPIKESTDITIEEGIIKFTWKNVSGNNTDPNIPDAFKLEFTSKDGHKKSSTITTSGGGADNPDVTYNRDETGNITCTWWIQDFFGGTDQEWELKIFAFNGAIIDGNQNETLFVRSSSTSYNNNGTTIIRQLPTVNENMLQVEDSKPPEQKNIPYTAHQIIKWDNYFRATGRNSSEVNFVFSYKFLPSGPIGSLTTDVTNIKVYTDVPDEKVGTIEKEQNGQIVVYLGALEMEYSLQVKPTGELQNYIKSNNKKMSNLKAPDVSGLTIKWDISDQKWTWEWTLTDQIQENVTFIVKDSLCVNNAPDYSTSRIYYVQGVTTKPQTFSGEIMPTRAGPLHYLEVAVKLGGTAGSANLSSAFKGHQNNSGDPEYVSFNLFSSGEGTPISPYVIDSDIAFKNIKYRMSKPENLKIYYDRTGAQVTEESKFYFIQTKDFAEDMPDSDAGNKNYIITEPLNFKGADKVSFDGVYNGNNKFLTYKISLSSTNATLASIIDSSFVNFDGISYNYGTALFPNLTGELRNVKLKLDLSGNLANGNVLIGGLVLKNYGRLSNCSIETTNFKNSAGAYLRFGSSKTIAIGGLVAVNYGEVIGCQNNATVDIKTTDNVGDQKLAYGGVVALNTAMINGCINNGTIDVSSSERNSNVEAGGIAYKTSKEQTQEACIYECINNGIVRSSKLSSSVISNHYAAGIVVIAKSQAKLYYNINLGAVDAENGAGVCYSLDGSSFIGNIGIGLVNGDVKKTLLSAALNQSTSNNNYMIGSDATASGMTTLRQEIHDGMELPCTYDGSTFTKVIKITWEAGAIKAVFTSVMN